jgi:hypothetical protein
MLALLRKLTVEQWRAIDEEYLDRPLPDTRIYGVLIAIAIALVIPRYFGSAAFILTVDAAREFIEAQAHPGLWPRLYWCAFKVINYFIIPVLCIKLVLRERVRDFGLSFRKEGKVWLLYAAMFLAVLPVTYGVSFSDAFLRTYPRYEGAGDSMEQFVIWGIAYGLQFLMLEFFFRGFALFALARHMGSTAIFVMVVPYGMIHLSKPLPEALGSILTGIVLGTISLRTRSIYGGVLVHVGVAWSMEIFALMQSDRLPW